MKKIKLQVIALVLVVASGFASCSNDDDQQVIITKKSFVSAVTGPTTGTVNQELVLSVTFDVENKCSVFNKFIETATDNTKVIEVETKLEGVDCGTIPVSKITTYKFKATAAGTYLFKFKKSATEFITQTIVVSSAS
ncbi:hypothetical protein [Flavobacterium sp. LB2R40]|uniref:hypothetical protein n=1 Tax=Flavobacterium sp. LB2R40 TaxID=3401722 RepID=UPI003AAECD90